MIRSKDRSDYSQKPTPGMCCLCGSLEVALVESRPTGEDAMLQSWPFCETCRNVNRQRPGNDAEICRRYIAFLKFVIGGCNLARKFNCNRANGIRGKLG